MLRRQEVSGRWKGEIYMKKMSKGKKVAAGIAGAVVLAAAGVYLGVSYYYSSHFFPKTVINGLNCAGLSVDQVKRRFRARS